MNFLVIGYGNSLRSDDGAGQKVADRIAEWNLPQVRSLAVHQLTPELAEEIAQVDVVFFIDAVAANPKNPVEVQIQELQTTDHKHSPGHSYNPRSLLVLAQVVYGEVTRAYWVLIPAVNFDFGEEFSSLTQQGIDMALKQVKKIINQKL